MSAQIRVKGGSINFKNISTEWLHKAILTSTHTMYQHCKPRRDSAVGVVLDKFAQCDSVIKKKYLRKAEEKSGGPNQEGGGC